MPIDLPQPKNSVKLHLMGMLKLILMLISITSTKLIFAEDNLHIDSTKLVVDRNKNTAIFTGNVLVCFHGMKLSTEKIIFTFDGANTKKIKFITFPVKLKALRETDNNSSVIIIADNALYTIDTMELLLKGNVIIEDKEEVIITDQMLYYGKLKNIVLDGK